MKSPFVIIRKYQKTLMVAVTLLAIFAFVVADSINRNMAGASIRDDVVVKTNAGDLKQSDMQNLLQMRQVANQFLERAASASGLNFRDVQNFLFTHGAGTMQEDVFFGHLLALKADELGIVVPNQTVDDYISRATQEKLSKANYRQIVSDMAVGQNQIFDALRYEIKVQTARGLLAPRAPLAPEQYWDIFKKLRMSQVMEVSPVPVEDFLDKVESPSETELQAWFDQYKDKEPNRSRDEFSPGFKQPRKVALQFAALRFADVQKQVKEANPITDIEIEEYYVANKDILYKIEADMELDGEELFKSEDEKSEEKPGEEPAKDADGPTLEPPAEETPKADKDPKEEPATEKNAAEEATDEPAEEPAGEPAESEAAEVKPEEPKTEEPEPAAESEEAPKEDAETESTDEEASADDAQSALPVDGAFGSVAEAVVLTAFSQAADEEAASEEEATVESTETTEESSDEENPPEENQPKLAAPADEKPAEEKKPEEQQAEEKDAEEKDAEEKKPEEEAVGTLEAPTEPKYRELDDALREEIRSALLNERTNVELARLSEKIAEEMNDKAFDHQEAIAPEEIDYDEDAPEEQKTPEQRKAEVEAAAVKQAPLAAKDLKAIAKAHNAEYHATGLVSMEELFEFGREENGDEGPLKDRIGEAVKVGPESASGQRQPSTLDLAFGSEHLYGVNTVRGAISNDHFVFWKVQDRAEHVPASLADVKDQVEKSWKMEKARAMAEEHAKKLAEGVGNKKSLAEGLPEGTPVRETNSFTWLYQPPNLNPNSFSPPPRPVISEVTFLEPIDDETGIELADDTFMKTVFNELKIGETGVVANGDLSEYYVVRIKNRDTLDPEMPEGTEFMKENKFTPPMFRQFMSTPYDHMAQYTQQMAVYEWAEELRKQFDVKWEEKQ